MINLLEYGYNKYSQSGQDGIIEFIFDRLGITEGHFVEFGAWDGIHLSNCRKLFEEGWSGIFIESDRDRFRDLRSNYLGENRVVCVNETVSDNFDNIYDLYGFGKEIHFMSIDVDGPDIEVFEKIEKNLPLVACIEGGMGAYPFEDRQPINKVKDVGQSLKTMMEIVMRKGYKILCSFQDTFVIREELFEYFPVSDDLLDLWIKGHQHYDYIYIPMYRNRLERNDGRSNRILNDIIELTNFQNYDSREEWAKDNENEIDGILDEINKSRKVNIACGNVYIPGFIHIDLIDCEHVDCRMDVRNLYIFGNNSVNLIYASHILEHFGRYEFEDVLKEWYRVLKSGGHLRLSVPDLVKYVELYSKTRNLKYVFPCFCGGQRNNRDYHNMVFDREYLSRILVDIGFRNVYTWNWRCTEHSNIDDYSQAYFPHMEKERGMLMSLNLEAVK